MSVSVIIPTYNRADILRKTLDGYSAQSGDHQILEVLVVDDGSKDHTASVVRECNQDSSVRLRYLYQENSGPATARNYAIREAKGDMLLLGDDDIVPSRQMVSEHVEWHSRHPEPEVGILGYVAWAPELNPTPFMQWSGLYGPQFNFGHFKPGMQVDLGYTYFCNTTVKASFLAKHGVFDEIFRTYAYEDLDLGYRLSKSGFRLLYNPQAIGYHYKYETFQNTLDRVNRLYEGWPLFSKTEAGQQILKLHPSGNRQPKKSMFKQLLSPLKACAMPLLKPLCDTHIPLPIWLYDQIFYYYARRLPFAPAFWD